MSDRYILREGSRGGERILAQSDDPKPLLDRRDELVDRAAAALGPRVILDVIDTDATDPPETGVMERCPGCGEPRLASELEL